MAGGMAFLD